MKKVQRYRNDVFVARVPPSTWMKKHFIFSKKCLKFLDNFLFSKLCDFSQKKAQRYRKKSRHIGIGLTAKKLFQYF